MGRGNNFEVRHENRLNLLLGWKRQNYPLATLLTVIN